MLIDTRVTHNLDIIDGSRFSFIHTHLEVNRVVLHIHLDGFYVKEQITTVRIEFAYSIVVTRQTVIERLEVIDVTGFDTQRRIQVLVRIDSVSHPFHGTHIVLISFTDGHIHIHTRRVFRIRHHTVRHDIRIAITVLIVFLDHRLLVFLVFFRHEFLGAEEIDDIVIVRLLHRLVDLPIGQGLVTGDIDLTHFRLGFLIDTDQHTHIARMIRIVLLDHMHFRVMKTFLGEVFLDYGLGMVLQVRRHLRALPDTGFYLDIFFLTLLDPLVTHFTDTRPLLQRNYQPDLIAFDLLGFDLHGRE